tara:strand:+ start:569 stop:790 length:222 start_codon:yes stop_codon:yes gene_type:complete
MKKLFSFLFLLIILIYQKVISPMLRSTCRYTPTCSEYGRQAIVKYGPFKGGFLAIKRISKCHPWGGSGEDLVP